MSVFSFEAYFCTKQCYEFVSGMCIFLVFASWHQRKSPRKRRKLSAASRAVRSFCVTRDFLRRRIGAPHLFFSFSAHIRGDIRDNQADIARRKKGVPLSPREWIHCFFRLRNALNKSGPNPAALPKEQIFCPQKCILFFFSSLSFFRPPNAFCAPALIVLPFPKMLPS